MVNFLAVLLILMSVVKFDIRLYDLEFSIEAFCVEGRILELVLMSVVKFDIRSYDLEFSIVMFCVEGSNFKLAIHVT